VRRVAIVTGARSAHGTGLENAEARLLHAVAGRRGEIDVRVRVVGRRTALGYARRLGARWVPSPRLAWRGAELIHLAGLSLPPPRGVPYLATFHDLAALVYPDEGALPPWGGQIARDAVP
jgi:hypothetical protein